MKERKVSFPRDLGFKIGPAESATALFEIMRCQGKFPGQKYAFLKLVGTRRVKIDCFARCSIVIATQCLHHR